MSQQVKSYKTNGLKKILYFISVFVLVVVIFIILAIVFSIRIRSLGSIIGISLVLTLLAFPKIYVDKDRVYYRIVLRKFNCPFDQGKFQIVEKTGIRALMFNLTIRTVGIEYTPDNSRKKIAFGWMLKESEVREIYAYIQTQQNTQTDHAETALG